MSSRDGMEQCLPHPSLETPKAIGSITHEYSNVRKKASTTVRPGPETSIIQEKDLSCGSISRSHKGKIKLTHEKKGVAEQPPLCFKT